MVQSFGDLVISVGWVIQIFSLLDEKLHRVQSVACVSVCELKSIKNFESTEKENDSEIWTVIFVLLCFL